MNELHLRYFLTVYHLCNLSKAADEIHISRQSLSRIIQDMEKQLGKPLFTRTKNGLRPTEAALELVHHANIILDEYEKIYHSDTLSELKARELTVYTFDAVTELFSSEFLTRFKARYPKILLNIEETTDAHARDSLLLHECDVAIVTDAINVLDFNYTLLFHSQYGVFINKQNPLAGKEVITFEDLKSEKIIGKTRSLQYYTRDTNLILKQGVNLDFVAEITNTSVVRRLVSDNIGIALAWDYSFLQDIVDDNIKFVPLLRKGWGSDVYAISNKERESKNARLFRAFLIDWIESHTHTEN